MSNFYFDTSAIVKRYHPEKGSNVVDKIFESKGHNLVTSFWTVLEFVVAFSLKRKRREVSQDGFKISIGNFLNELIELFVVMTVDNEVIISSLSCAMKYALSSADSLQLASTLKLKSVSEGTKERTVLISADEEFCKAAIKEGLDVINPRKKEAMQRLKEITS